MSHGFMVWAVDTDKLRQVAGSHDDKLRRMIGGRFKHDIARLDDLFKRTIADGAPNTYEALRQIVDGTIAEGARDGAIYRYAFKLVVEHFGSFLDNGAVMPWSSPDFGPVDKALADRGVPLKMNVFYGFSLPIDLPYPDDFPVTGCLDAAAVTRIDAAFTRARPAALAPEVGDIVDCVRGWFREAAAKQRGLVSYYH